MNHMNEAQQKVMDYIYDLENKQRMVRAELAALRIKDEMYVEVISGLITVRDSLADLPAIMR